jgi:CBS domain-containing protein
VQANGRSIDFGFINGHFVIPATALSIGANTLQIEFDAGDPPLNRHADFLYTLFVPAHARQAIPCFDQPDLKGRWTVRLEHPAHWQSVANGREIERTQAGARTRVRFAETPLLPTYLVAFVAGEFEVETGVRNGRTMRFFHRETDTEKVARKGFHLGREYAVDPLEILFVREVMRSNAVVLSATTTLGELQQSLRTNHRRSQRLLPVVNAGGQFVGVLTRDDVRKRVADEGQAALQRPLIEIVRRETVAAYPDEPLRVVVYRMAEKGFTRMPVIMPGTGEFMGLIALDDLLKARGRNLEEEIRRERPLKLRFLSPTTSGFDNSEGPSAG